MSIDCGPKSNVLTESDSREFAIVDEKHITLISKDSGVVKNFIIKHYIIFI